MVAVGTDLGTKKCQHCGGRFSRRRNVGAKKQLEAPSKFAKRKFCSQFCQSRFISHGRRKNRLEGGKKYQWDPWKITPHESWNLNQGDYWKMKDPWWSPYGMRGQELTRRLFEMIDMQVGFVKNHEVMSQLRRIEDITKEVVESLLVNVLPVDYGLLSEGCVRRIYEELKRIKLVRK